MNSTTICSVSGCVSAVCFSLQGVSAVDQIPYLRPVTVVMGIIAGAVFAYFAKGRKDSGQV